jgi:hypothetical protein
MSKRDSFQKRSVNFLDLTVVLILTLIISTIAVNGSGLSFALDGNPPYVPNNPNPINGTTGISPVNAILSWLGGDPDPGDNVTYDVYFGGWSSPPLLVVNITNPSYAFNTTLNYTTTYYWRIRAWDNHGNYTFGPEWNFQTEINNLPYPPSNPNPANGATGIPIIDTILSWWGGDPDPGDTVTYDLYFGNYTSPPLIAGNLTNASYALGELNPSTTYYWRIKAWDNHGNYTLGSQWNFQTVINNAPNMPSPVYPEDGATGIPIIDTILNWLGGDPDPGDTVTYDVYFGNQTSQPLAAGNLTTASYELDELNYNTTYCWYIKAWDNHGNWTQGQQWDFQTGIPNNPPVALDQGVATFINTPVNITLEATDEGPLNYYIVDDSQHGTLSGSLPEVIYTPDSGFEGRDSFTFKAFDGEQYSNVATVAMFIWREVVRLDSADGTQPTLSYAPNGDLRIFFNMGDETSNHMIVRKRLGSEDVFGPDISVYDLAKTVAIHYDATGKLDLAVDKGDRVAVLQSLDNGDTWNFVKDYIATNNGHLEALPLSFVEDSPSHLRLFYKFMDWHPLYGPFPRIRYTQRTNDIWDSSVSFADGQLHAAYENGDKVTVFQPGGIHHSIDNGVTFTFRRGNTIPEYLDSNDFQVGPGGRLFILRTYDYGPEPNHQLVYRYSDDVGTTWSENQFIITNGSNYIRYPRFAIDGNKIVAAWTETEPPDYKDRILKCTISEDGGNTWSSEQTIVHLQSPMKFGVPPPTGFIGLDVECYGNKFSVAYSVLEDLGMYGLNRYGAYLMELNLQEIAVNNPPILNPIGNRGVYVGDPLVINVSASDVDPGDQLSLNASPLPSGANFVDYGNGTGMFTWTPNSNQTGQHPVLFSVSDGDANDSEQITITVSRRGGGSCFLSGTPILMADGSTKLIEDVKVGDMILAYDVDAGKTIEDKVKETFIHDADSYLIVNNDLKATANHPVYSKGKWVEVGTLNIGDTILNYKGAYEEVKSIQEVKADVKVYNLEVNPYHTYIANGYVVHNKTLMQSSRVGND